MNLIAQAKADLLILIKKTKTYFSSMLNSIILHAQMTIFHAQLKEFAQKKKVRPGHLRVVIMLHLFLNAAESIS